MLAGTVFDAHVEDFLNILSKQQHVNEERILRLRGLPWNATKQDIANFFHGNFYLTIFVVYPPVIRTTEQ